MPKRYGGLTVAIVIIMTIVIAMILNYIIIIKKSGVLVIGNAKILNCMKIPSCMFSRIWQEGVWLDGSVELHGF